MVRDQWMRWLFIPLLGVLIPFFSGAITYRFYSLAVLVVAQLYFFLVSFSIWQGCHWIHGKLRRLYTGNGSPYPKIVSICLISALYGAAIAGLLFLVWTKGSLERFSEAVFVRFLAFSAFAVVIFTLLYEVLYLSKEREADRRLVQQLDKEKTWAELQALHNELEPHFLFNSLTTLSYLIRQDPGKALLFDRKLAQVFHYFLRHKSDELVPLEEELDFIRDYFYLLQIRHGEKLRLSITGSLPQRASIVPCALQILVENAIKHNGFSAKQPLRITLTLRGNRIVVQNNRQAKNSEAVSTRIGLANLRQRYHLICRLPLVVEETDRAFTVSLPLDITSNNPLYYPSAG